MEMAKGDYSTFCVIEYAPVVELLISSCNRSAWAGERLLQGMGSEGVDYISLGAASEYSTRIIIK